MERAMRRRGTIDLRSDEEKFPETPGPYRSKYTASQRSGGSEKEDHSTHRESHETGHDAGHDAGHGGDHGGGDGGSH